MNWTFFKDRIPQTPSARAALAIAGAVLAVGFIWLTWSAYHGRLRAGASVALLRQQATVMASQADEIARLRQVKRGAQPAADMRADILAAVQSAGIGAALVRIDALGADRAQVIFGTVAFADWLAWSAALEGRGFWIESGRVEASTEPGMVGATAVLSRSGR